MDTRPVCCDPCEDRDMCTAERNCCVECHIAYEEELALPFLPPPLRMRLMEEHQHLDAMGYPADAVDAHAKWEEQVFRLYCPPEVCEQIEADHVAHSHGKLVSRASVAPRRVANPARSSYSPQPTPGLLRVWRVQADVRRAG